MGAAGSVSNLISRFCFLHQSFVTTTAVVSTSSHNQPNASADELEQSWLMFVGDDDVGDDGVGFHWHERIMLGRVGIWICIDTCNRECQTATSHLNAYPRTWMQHFEEISRKIMWYFSYTDTTHSDTHNRDTHTNTHTLRNTC